MNQKEYEERMQDSHYKELMVTKCTSGDDYVFVSYRGNSWRRVLSDIVYKLQKKYGLRIYFDKEFASKTNIWIEQFQENMDDGHCKAFLCFFDEGYVTSYATLLELMHAMNKKSKLSGSIVSINFDIQWDKLDDVTYDTGLGKEDQSNPGYKEEKEAFDYEFGLLKNKEGYESIEEYYRIRQKTALRACDCKDIMFVLQPKNMHVFADIEEFYIQHVLKPLYEITDGSVFESPDKIEKLINGEIEIPEMKDPGGSFKNDGKIETEVRVNTEEKPNMPKPPKPQKPKEPPKPPKLPQPIGLPLQESLTKNTTLKEFREFCEYAEFCLELREIRENGKKQYFDYLVAALLRGCDEAPFKTSKGVEEVSNLARWNYCTYAVSRTLNPDLPVCGASQFTWTSNARKAVGIEKAGKLGKNSFAFEKLGEDVTLGQIEQYFTDADEAAFSTRDNALVLQSLNAILQMDVKKILERIGV